MNDLGTLSASPWRSQRCLRVPARGLSIGTAPTPARTPAAMLTASPGNAPGVGSLTNWLLQCSWPQHATAAYVVGASLSFSQGIPISSRAASPIREAEFALGDQNTSRPHYTRRRRVAPDDTSIVAAPTSPVPGRHVSRVHRPVGAGTKETVVVVGVNVMGLHHPHQMHRIGAAGKSAVSVVRSAPIASASVQGQRFDPVAS